MSFILKLLTQRALNPIMIKELRQVTRSRFLIGMILLYMLVMLAAVGFFILNMTVTRASDWSSGRNLFSMLLPILNFSCALLVPLYVGIRMAIEHSDTNIDLLFTTPLNPGEIIRGKLINGVIITLILYSICTPFLVFSYLLRGIDIPTMFVVLIPLFLITVLIIQASLFIAVIPASKPFKALLGLAATGFVLFGLFGSSILVFEIVPSGIVGYLDSWDFWGPFLSILTAAILLFILLHAFTVSLVMPPASNRAFPVRVACVIAWLTVGIGLAIWAAAQKMPESLVAWSIPTLAGFSIVFIFSLGEADKMRTRVRRQIPESRIIRPLAFLFYSGSAGGIALCCIVAFLTLATSMILLNVVPASHGSYYIDRKSWWLEYLQNIGGLFLFVLAYGFTAIAVRRFVFRDMIPCKFTGVMTLLMMMIGSLVPSLIGVILAYDDIRNDSLGFWQITNPGGVFDPKFHNISIAFVSAWVFIMFIVTAPWMFRQAREFMSAGKGQS